jgi:hypothetical protein
LAHKERRAKPESVLGAALTQRFYSPVSPTPSSPATALAGTELKIGQHMKKQECKLEKTKGEVATQSVSADEDVRATADLEIGATIRFMSRGSETPVGN